MKSKNFILLILFLIVTYSCTDDNEVNSMPSVEDMFSTESWIMISSDAEPSIDYNGDGNESSDIFEQLLDCEKDNIFFWRNDGSFTYTEGELKCDFNNPELINSGKWHFNEQKTRFTEQFFEDNVIVSEREYLLIGLTATHLTIRYERSLKDSISYTITNTFVHPVK